MQVAKKFGVRSLPRRIRVRSARRRGSKFGVINPQSAIRNPKSNGFTLVEIVITIVLIGILSGIAALIILQGVKAYSGEQSRSDVHYQARVAMERMTREIRHIQNCAAITGPANPSNTLTFTDINGNNVVFSVAGGNLTRGVGDLLATGITSTQPFRFLDQNGNETTACSAPPVPTDIWFVEISLTDTQNSETLDMRTRVHPRNFW